MTRPEYPNDTRIVRVLRLSGLALLILAVIFLLQNIHADFEKYADTEDALYAAATTDANREIKTFADRIDVVGVRVVNPTGGTVSVYVGQLGAKQQGPEGVEMQARPELVDTLVPRSVDTFSVHHWQGKYVASVTSYIFLQPASGPALNLIDASYEGAAGYASTTYVARANTGDSNYRPYADDAGASLKTGYQLAAEQEQSTSSYASSRIATREMFPNDLHAYFASIGDGLFQSILDIRSAFGGPGYLVGRVQPYLAGDEGSHAGVFRILKPDGQIVTCSWQDGLRINGEVQSIEQLHGKNAVFELGSPSTDNCNILSAKILK